MSKDLNFKSLLNKDKLVVLQNRFKRYYLFSFLAFVALIYGFVLLQINTLRSSEPSPLDVSSQVQAAQVPHINESVVKQLKSLQDNSVSAKALFDEARSNPFQ